MGLDRMDRAEQLIDPLLAVSMPHSDLAESRQFGLFVPRVGGSSSVTYPRIRR